MQDFKSTIQTHQVSLKTVFPSLKFNKVVSPDMSVNSLFFEDDPHHEDLLIASKRLQKFQHESPNALLANGYLEQRSFYNTAAFERITHGEKEFRNIHLGTDFWIPAGTPVHAPFEATVVVSHNNDYHKDYGPTLVLEHQLGELVFYTLYGHLSRSSLEFSEKGKKVPQGALIGSIGDETENGHWVPHLHFQIITDLMGNTENYNGVAFSSELKKWKKLCPDPNFIFKENLHSAK